MKTYIKFIISIFLRSFLNIFLIMFSLVFILNLLSELDFFKQVEIHFYYPIYLALLNSPSLIFEMFPFIFLLSTQVFFINLFRNNEIQVFKYSGLENITIIKILSYIAFLIGLIIVIFLYNFTANSKNIYLEKKSNYTSDDKYLAVITNNGLWIKDKIDNKTIIINSSKIEENYLIDTFISIFDENYEIIKNIKSEKINIDKNEWIIFDAKIFINNQIDEKKTFKLKSNFTYQKIQSLFSILSSLSIIELFELKKNYKMLGYSTVEVDVQVQKLIAYPFYYLLMTIFSCLIMFNTKKFNNKTLKITIGLFSSVIIYYINNFFYVLGNTEKIPILVSIWMPLVVLGLTVILMMRKINEK